MSTRSTETFADVLARLARADVADWQGLPAGLDWRAHVDAEDPPAAGMLGTEYEPADMLRVSDAAPGTTARAWLRHDAVVLLDVPVAAAASEGRTGRPSRPVGPGVPEALGAPERRLDVRYGLQPLPEGEWVYAGRGLALVVADGRVRHVMGFAPCRPEEYVRRLRVGLATERRPLQQDSQEDDL